MSTSLLQVQISDQHLAFSVQQQLLSVYHGDAFYPSEKHSWSNFLVKKKGQEKNETRSSGTQIFLFTSLYAIQKLLFSAQYEKHSPEREHKGLNQFYWETLIFIAVGFTWVKTECWIPDAPEAQTEMGFRACMKYRHRVRLCLEDSNAFSLLPSKHSSASQSQPRVQPDPWAAFLPQPTNHVLHLYHPSKHFGVMVSGLWGAQYHLSANQVFLCPFTEVTPYCCWQIHIYNDRSFALTSSPPQRVYYWNANSTIAVMTLFYKAHISGTFANGLKKWSS